VRTIHAVIAPVGLIVILGVLIAALVSDWRTLILVVVAAGIAGEITRRAVPKEERAELLDRLTPSTARRRRDP
jgi:hypothetical protein